MWDYAWKFVVFGDSNLNTIIREEDGRDHGGVSFSFEKIIHKMNIYWEKYTWIKYVQVQNYNRFVGELRKIGFRKYFFEGTTGMIFTSQSLEHTATILDQYKEKNVFEFVTNNTMIFIATEVEKEVEQDTDYLELFGKYINGINADLFGIYYISKSNLTETLDKIFRDIVLVFSRKQNMKHQKLTGLQMCAICHDDQQPLQIQDNFIICDNCDPTDFDEDKVRAWLKIDREGL